MQAASFTHGKFSRISGDRIFQTNTLIPLHQMKTRPVRMTAKKIHLTLANLGNPDIAAHSKRFFKTRKGEYGEGDRFLGIRVPVLRQKKVSDESGVI